MNSMEPAGGRLSDYFTAAARRVVIPPNAKHGSEDEHDRRSPTIRGSGLYPKASPESPFMGRIEKPSETGESRPSQTRLSRVEGELQRAAHIREAEVEVNPMDWQLPHVINYFEEQGVKQAGLDVCREIFATGRWVDTLFNHVSKPELESFLKHEFMMDKITERVNLTHNVRTLFEDARREKILLTSPASIHDANNRHTLGVSNRQSPINDDHSTRKRKTFLGDKSVTIPSFPKVLDGKGVESITRQEWKGFTTSVRIYSSLESSAYADLVDKIYDVPDTQIDERILDFMTPDEVDLDKTLGLHMFMHCPTSIKKHMTPRDQYELQKGHTSGLKILAYLGRKINRKTSDRRVTLINQMSSRSPIANVMELENEIIEVQLMLDELEHQGIHFDAEILYANWVKSVSTLMLTPNPLLHNVLQLPIVIYEMKPKDEVKDGYKFMELLRTIAENIMYDDKYESLRKVKPKANAFVASVVVEGKKKAGKHFSKAKDITTTPKIRLPGHIMNPPIGFPCVNERELGKCQLERCRATHDYKGWVDSECKSPSYLKFSVCPGFLPGRREDGFFCKHKHAKNPIASEITSKRKEAAAHFTEMWAICEECDSDFGKDGSEQSEDDEDDMDYLSGMVCEAYDLQSTNGENIMMAEEASTRPSFEDISAVVSIPDSAKVLIDGGTFAHMFGTGVVHLLQNRRKVAPKVIQTASGLAGVNEMADLMIGKYELRDGYVNPHMSTTLLCEGALQKLGWQFLGAGEEKAILSPQGDFVAERHGNLHFWPVIKWWPEKKHGGKRRMHSKLHPNPEQDHPIGLDFANKVSLALKRVHNDGRTSTRILTSHNHGVVQTDSHNASLKRAMWTQGVLQPSFAEEWRAKERKLKAETQSEVEPSHKQGPWYPSMKVCLPCPPEDKLDHLGAYSATLNPQHSSAEFEEVYSDSESMERSIVFTKFINWRRLNIEQSYGLRDLPQSCW